MVAGTTTVKSLTEAMLFTLPKEGGRRSPQEHSSGYGLVDAVNRLDVETDQVETYTANLRDRQREPEISDSPFDNGENPQDMPAVSPRSIARVVYAENKRKARLAQALFEHLGQKVIEPLYCQPSDTAIYHEKKRKYEEFKETLNLHFKRKPQERQDRADPSPDTPNHPASFAEWNRPERQQCGVGGQRA
ncbi:hypothetical protein HPB48_012307 [Haemaphysalis longicornis]|uniref:Uncharacterized protein n=1 Tax=Haemaphysalis longicornis TaxID=44386 RepID=A0A9J6GM47_HAELO|nr:hypothetical protein HPB48_012307 [Haemaphysalis longicornis]